VNSDDRPVILLDLLLAQGQVRNEMSKFSSITIPVLEERLRGIAFSPQGIVSPLLHKKAIQETLA
jgi:hypothetical protein